MPRYRVIFQMVGIEQDLCVMLYSISSFDKMFPLSNEKMRFFLILNLGNLKNFMKTSFCSVNSLRRRIDPQNNRENPSGNVSDNFNISWFV